MKYKPVASTLTSQLGQKQVFTFDQTVPLQTERLNTSFEVGSIKGGAVKLSSHRFHLTSVRLPSDGETGSGDTLHIELVVRHHPGVAPARLNGLVAKLQDIVTQPRFSEELLEPGILG